MHGGRRGSVWEGGGGGGEMRAMRRTWSRSHIPRAPLQKRCTYLNTNSRRSQRYRCGAAWFHAHGVKTEQHDARVRSGRTVRRVAEQGGALGDVGDGGQ